MECNIEKECSALGGLFQQTINDMKNSSFVWEDFTSKAAKLHSTLRVTILATGAFLDSFQKLADLATNTKGGTREIGSALTRLCMRHRSIETKLKAFTSSIVEALVNPLQDKIEDWKKTVVQLDKDHAKEYKKARQEIKRASTDTIRLQKKVKKGKSDVQSRLSAAMHDFNEKMRVLEETERDSVRLALTEERSRFCLLVSCLKPVVDAEISMLADIGHLQEIIKSLCLHAADPHRLPPASEQVILDTKGSDSSTWSFQSPPSSPTSLGSRKSSMCSMSSANSSSGSSVQSHVSPAHHYRHSTAAQQLMPGGAMRLSSVSSQDSGFTSQDTLFLKPITPPLLQYDRKNSLHESNSSGGSNSSGSSTGGSSTEHSGAAATPPSPHFPCASSTSASTWSNWPEPPRPAPLDVTPERPHTISTAYEGRSAAATRPHLTSHTFQPPPPAARTAPCTPYEGAAGGGGGVVKGTEGRRMHARPVALPTVPNFNMSNNDQVIPQPVYMYPDELVTPKQDEVTGSIEGDNGSPNDRQKPKSFVIPGQQENGSDGDDLEQAIRDLDASTAALERLECDRQRSATSLPSSSGYDTMSTASSADHVPLHCPDVHFPPFDLFPTDAFYTIPRNNVLSRSFRAPSTPRRPASTAGVPSMYGGTVAAVRRSSTLNCHQRPPPPPIRRNSSITGSLSSAAAQTGDGSVSAATTPSATFAAHRRTFSEGSLDDDIDDLPLPPPPPELLVDYNELDAGGGGSGGGQAEKRNSAGLVSSHASIIDCLNRKFAANIPKPGFQAAMAAASAGTREGRSQESSGEVTPTAEVVVQTGFLQQIQRGVSLRRAVTNDRSTPKLP